MAVAYDGNEPYIFISYSHKDSADVLRAVEALNDHRFRVWYDNGIEAGTEWPEYIAERMINSQVVIAFMSRNSQDSHNCRREIHFAIELKKMLLVVYLEDFELSPGMRLQLSALQAMYRAKYKDDEDFLLRLCNAAIIQKCKAPVNISKPQAAQETKEVVDVISPSFVPVSKPALKTDTVTEAVSKTGTQEPLRKAVFACNENKAVRKSFYFKFADEVSQKQLENAVNAIAKGKITHSDIIAIMDDTLRQNGKSGYIVTKNHFFAGGTGFLSTNFDFTLDNLTQAEISKSDHLRLSYKNGNCEDLFFSIYTRYFEVFFNTYINEAKYL